jgi:Zn-dependent alcohol dehydrogenase
MRTKAAVIREPGKPWEITELELDEPRQGEVRIAFKASGMCHSDEHLQTGDSTGRLPMVGVLSAEVVDQAAAIVGKGCQITVTSVGRSSEKQIQLAANGSVAGWQRRIQGHVFGMCNPLYDIPRLLRLYRPRPAEARRAHHPAVLTRRDQPGLPGPR